MKSNINNEFNSQVSLLADIAEDLDIEINYHKFQNLDLKQCLLIMKLGSSFIIFKSMLYNLAISFLKNNNTIFITDSF